VPVITEMREAMRGWAGTWEILVVDDCSRDKSVERALEQGVRVVKRVQNGGSGASRKTGVRNSRGVLVAMLDTDGTYVASHMQEMLAYFPDYDQVNGARTSEEGTIKVLRVPAKWFIRKLAEFISQKKIPDLNTGMKIFKRDLMLRYLWVMPEGFSCVTSMTLAFLANHHPVKYVPIGYRKRIGKSKFHPIHDTAKYGSTVIRMIMYFRPLRVFVPLAVIMGVAAIAKSCYDFFIHPKHSLEESDIILAVAALMVLAIGLLADLIVAHRREPV
jgi:glycosyltransferase involved in cell wall biosynthesis